MENPNTTQSAIVPRASTDYRLDRPKHTPEANNLIKSQQHSLHPSSYVKQTERLASVQIYSDLSR